jgi:hypothetical protein
MRALTEKQKATERIGKPYSKKLQQEQWRQ